MHESNIMYVLSFNKMRNINITQICTYFYNHNTYIVTHGGFILKIDEVTIDAFFSNELKLNLYVPFKEFENYHKTRRLTCTFLEKPGTFQSFFTFLFVVKIYELDITVILL